jgi:hypothetical protein
MEWKKVRPRAEGTAGPQGLSKLTSWNSRTLAPNPREAQAPSLPPDDRGLSDLEFFLRHRDLSERDRFAFENEFPGLPGEPGFVHVTLLDRFPNGHPRRRRRRAFCFDGGRA